MYLTKKSGSINVANEILENLVVFLIVFAIFLPYLSKTVRLATRTWRNRENLPEETIKRVVFLVPSVILLGFIFFYLFVIFLVGVIQF